MPDLKSFLDRWSRLKQASGKDASHLSRETPEPAATLPEPLPRIEDLGPGSDFARFMKPDIPAGLRRAALRRAWPAAPAIAAHRPLVDYDWDFHAPGFGRLRPQDDAAKFVAALFPALEERAEAETARPKEAASGTADSEMSQSSAGGSDRHGPAAG